jgi:hypothetical protein
MAGEPQHLQQHPLALTPGSLPLVLLPGKRSFPTPGPGQVSFTNQQAERGLVPLRSDAGRPFSIYPQLAEPLGLTQSPARGDIRESPLTALLQESMASTVGRHGQVLERARVVPSSTALTFDQQGVLQLCGARVSWLCSTRLLAGFRPSFLISIRHSADPPTGPSGQASGGTSGQGCVAYYQRPAW